MTAQGAPSPARGGVFPQSIANAVRVYVGTKKIRNRDSAEYFIRWIDKLEAMAAKAQGWRTPAERAHVFSQFRQARQVYERLASEAQQSSP